jgi:sugar/nucleoside kinase (ribokinase family)
VSILSVGTVAFDSIETPFDAVDRVLGGSATYTCLTARYFTDDVRLSAVVGGDFPERYIQMFRSQGIDIAGLDVRPEGKTFYWHGRYDYDLSGRDTLATHLNVLEGFDPVLPAKYADARIVCLGNLDPVIQSRVLDQVDRPDLVICDTMNYWIEHTHEQLLDTLKRVDVFILNDEEARQLAQHPNLVRAVGIIREMGPETIVVKKGENGAMLFADDSIFWTPALPLERIEDPTGAGDTFMGGFAGYLAGERRYELDDLKRAVVFGSAMASFVVERFGPARLMDLDRKQIDGRVDAFRQLSAIPSTPVVA